MGSVQFTFWFSSTSSQTYMLPYLGDISSAENFTLGYPGTGYVSSLGWDQSAGAVAKKISPVHPGRQNINMLLNEGASGFFLGIDEHMTKGFNITPQAGGLGYATSVSSVYSGKLNGACTSQFSERSSWGEASAITLALATINNILTIGIVITGESNGEESSLFLSGIDSNSAFLAIYNDSTHRGDPFNPYSGGGTSGPGGGDPSKQNWSEDSDFVGPDALPDETQYGALASNLVTIFSPTAAQMQQLAKLLWAKDFFTYVANMVTNIEDLFISFGMVPFTITGANAVAITWFEFYTSAAGTVPVTYAYLNKAPKQFYEFNMGSIALDGSDPRIFASDSVLDYSPYSKLGIYLPFIGYQELDIDECRGSTLTLHYRIDILSGACLALIEINGRYIYQFCGNCLTQLPLTSEDSSGAISNAINVGIAMASAGATGAIASAGEVLTAEKVAEGSISGAAGDLQNAQQAARVSNANGSLAGATANAVMGMKPNYKKSGAISGAMSTFGVKQPYLFLTTPRQSVPDGYQKVSGLPCNEGDVLGNFSGYTVVEDIRLNGLVATSPEVEEIYQLLKSGVII